MILITIVMSQVCLAQNNTSSITGATIITNETRSEYPFVECPGSANDLMVRSLELVPNPPKKGSEIQMGMLGEVDEQLSEGAFLDLSVFFMNACIFNQNIPFDELVKNGMPVGPGPLTMNHSVAIPNAAPPGIYTVQLTFYDQTDTQIQCIRLQFPL